MKDPIVEIRVHKIKDFGLHNLQKYLIHKANRKDLPFSLEFNDLTRKMTLLREALKRPKTESGRVSGPIVVNASVQALQVGNVSDVLAAKQFIHDCIVELTLVDHFLDGNEEMTAHYRGKLENAIGKESAKAKTIVIQGASIAPSGLETISHGQTIVSDSAIGTSDDLARLHTKEVEAQTEVIKTKDENDASGSQIHNDVPHDANELLEFVESSDFSVTYIAEISSNHESSHSI